MKNVTSIIECLAPKIYTDVRPFTGLVDHYRHFMKDFAKIATPLYDLTSGENRDKKSEPVVLFPKTLEAFETLKQKCVQAPIMSFPDFKRLFLLQTDTSGKGLSMVLSQKQDDGRYHPITFTSRMMPETEQRYHSNRKEFLEMKWALIEQFHKYLFTYGKNWNEFVV